MILFRFIILLLLFLTNTETMKVIINAKGSTELKEAIRVVAFETRKRSSSALIIGILEKNPKIAAKLKEIENKNK